MSNPFLHDTQTYVDSRDLNVLKHEVEDAATYLQRQTGEPYEKCLSFARQRIDPSQPGGMTDPDTMVLTRGKNGDRKKEVVPFSRYLSDIIQNGHILAPTWTVYQHQSVKVSLSAEFISVGMEDRNVSKAEMFQARADGNKAHEKFKKEEQNALKTGNNAVSGAQGSTGTIFFNKSAHPGLTSTCRTVTSYGNASTEKFLYGNRHYWKPEIVKANIINTINKTDMAALEAVMQRYDLVYPDAEQALAVVTYSTQLYWRNDEQVAIIHELLGNLSALERAAFVYTGDMFHLAYFNDGVVRTFLTRLSTKASQPDPDPDTPLDAMDSDQRAFVSLLCAQEIAGTSIAETKQRSEHDYAIIGATARNVQSVLVDYTDLIQVLWRTFCLPASIANIRSSIRRGVVTSDTDSTIFTVQDWVIWYQGEINFGATAKGLAYAIVYLATQLITHVLGVVSGQLGTSYDHIHTLSMKNELAFPTFVLTSMAKHYFAYVEAQEGNLFSKFKTEIKGVNLVNSNASVELLNEFHDWLRWTMDSIIENKEVSVVPIIDRLVQIENEVYNSVVKGSTSFLNRGQIRSAKSYQKPYSSPYVHYLLWQDVFAPKYGDAPEVPYGVLKVSVELGSPAKMRAWFNSIEDKALAERAEAFMAQYEKKAITSLLLPGSIVDIHGIPEEIVQAMDVRSIIYMTVKPFYLLLESFGIYLINDRLTRLVSDAYSPIDVLQNQSPDNAVVSAT